MSTSTLFQFDTELTADTVEWCPTVHHENLAACGTYQLDTETGRRHGSLSLHHTRTPITLGDCTKVLQNKVLEYGILDMKWKTQSAKALLALASSSGDMVFIESPSQMTTTNKYAPFEELGKLGVSSGLCLSLDWSLDTSQGQTVAVSDSRGAVSIVDSGEGGGGGLRLLQSWHAHEFEAWIVCHGWQSHSVYSGGDDCRLCLWDTRSQLEKPAITCRQHTMGVCSLQVHPFQECLLASGSYDEHILLWDVRSMRRPVKETAVGGGVWRVKWHPENPDLMATACMHNGFQILNWHLKDAAPAETVCSYSQHGSLAYGIDWSRAQTGAVSTHLLASCSFYDNSLHFWTAHL